MVKFFTGENCEKDSKPEQLIINRKRIAIEFDNVSSGQLY